MTLEHEAIENSTDDLHGGDPVREVRNEMFVAEFATEAEDMLHIVREMLPEQRKSIEGDLLLAQDFIARALLEIY